MTKKDAIARVAAGAAFLDRKAPGWASRVDVGLLRLSNCFLCVMGQLFGAYDSGRDKLALSHDAAFAYGFHRSTQAEIEGWIVGPDRDWYLLQDAWIVAIADRVVPKIHVQAEAEAVPVGAAR